MDGIVVASLQIRSPKKETNISMHPSRHRHDEYTLPAVCARVQHRSLLLSLQIRTRQRLDVVRHQPGGLRPLYLRGGEQGGQGRGQLHAAGAFPFLVTINNEEEGIRGLREGEENGDIPRKLVCLLSLALFFPFLLMEQSS